MVGCSPTKQSSPAPLSDTFFVADTGAFSFWGQMDLALEFRAALGQRRHSADLIPLSRLFLVAYVVSINITKHVIFGIDIGERQRIEGQYL